MHGSAYRRTLGLYADFFYIVEVFARAICHLNEVVFAYTTVMINRHVEVAGQTLERQMSSVKN